MHSTLETLKAIEILREDHRKIEHLLEDFDEAPDERSREGIAAAAFKELTVHSTLEEEVFYPALRNVFPEGSRIEDALKEHQGIEELITELEHMLNDGGRFLTEFEVLAENVRNHIRDEENLIFPELEELDLDWDRLGEQMSERKDSLLEEIEALTLKAKEDELARVQPPKKQNHSSRRRRQKQKVH